jgi:cytochrome o ubiquinol oxidase subunit II
VKLEIIWWILPIIIIAILGTVTWISTHKLDPYKPLNSSVKPIKIQVISLQWRWLFIYPDQHIATMNFVEFPVNTPIDFEITSDAPMNSFMIQQLAGQIYSMAGMTTKLHLIANQVGDYRGLSVSYSGEGFSNMYFTAHVVNQDQFNNWVIQTQQSPNALALKSYNALALPSKDTKALYFNLADENLFNEVVNKYMGPDMAMPKMQSMPNMSVKN